MTDFLPFLLFNQWYFTSLRQKKLAIKTVQALFLGIPSPDSFPPDRFALSLACVTERWAWSHAIHCDCVVSKTIIIKVIYFTVRFSSCVWVKHQRHIVKTTTFCTEEKINSNFIEIPCLKNCTFLNLQNHRPSHLDWETNL